MNRRSFLRSVVGAGIAAVVPLLKQVAGELAGSVTVYFPTKELGVLGDFRKPEINVHWVKSTHKPGPTWWEGSKLIGTIGRTCNELADGSETSWHTHKTWV